MFHSIAESAFRYGLGWYDSKLAKSLEKSVLPPITVSMVVTLASYVFRGLIGKVFPSVRNRVIHLVESDPFKRGKELGERCKDEITLLVFGLQELYVKREEDGGTSLVDDARRLEPSIPPEFIEEMKGVAAGAGVLYEQILLANTITDTMELFGCSLCAVSEDAASGEKTRALATNYFDTVGRGKKSVNIDDAFKRFDTLNDQAHSSDSDALKEALKKVNCSDTVQSIIFDTSTGDIELATGAAYAASNSYTTIKGEDLFGKDAPAGRKTDGKIVKLARTLDWPVSILGAATNVTVYPAPHGKNNDKYKTAVVGWPGMLGALSGINEKGLAIAISVVSSKKQVGTPNPFLFKKILQEAKNMQEAIEIVNKHRCASPMNLMVATTEGIARFELDPKRARHGAAHVSHGISEPVQKIAANSPEF